MHSHWKEQRTKLKEYLTSKNLEELAGSIEVIKSKLKDEVS
jgi:predicted house-cleaning noncanonical NTP pyrophosphatase (MazG superfamily)